MSNMAFVILLPDARRQTVKVTSDICILQILEDACAKRGLNPNEWSLKHINREVDLGNSVRFSGLPNNATLEMVQSTKPRVESPVTIVIQVDSGKRLSHQFTPSETLWNILEYWSSKGENILPSSTDMEPVCIYTRQEIIGREKLGAKTLKSLGLYQGSALIRLIHRSANNYVPEQANVSSVLRRPSTNDQAATEGKSAMGSNELHTNAVPPNNSVTEKPCPVKTPVHSPPKSNNQSVSNSTPTTQPEPPTSKNTLSSTKENHTAVNVNASRAEAVPPTLATPTASAGPQQPRPTRAADLRAQRGDFHILGPNDAVVYHADDVALPEIETPPDEFFDITVRDVETMYRSLRQQRMELEEAPLQTETARAEKHDSYVQSMLESHPVTIVRIRFPDRYVLQGTFRTSDSMAVIYDFVRQYIRNDRQNFYLFTTPPKKVLPESSTLIDENMVGYAVIYFGATSTESPLLKETLRISDPEKVFHFTPNPGHLLPRGRNAPPPASASGGSTGAHHPERQPEPGPSAGGGGAHKSTAGRAVNSNIVPKWFKK